MRRYLAYVSAALASLVLALALELSFAPQAAGAAGKDAKTSPACQACKNSCSAQLNTCVSNCADSACSQQCVEAANTCLNNCSGVCGR